jgi:hypothetical protein
VEKSGSVSRINSYQGMKDGRAAALISIAHPEDPEELAREARTHGLLPPSFPVSMSPKEGEARRYPSYQERRTYKVPANSIIWGYDWDPTQSGK